MARLFKTLLAALSAASLVAYAAPAFAQGPSIETKAQAKLQAEQCQATYGKADRSTDLFMKAGICLRDCMAHSIYGNAHTLNMCTQGYEQYTVSLAATLAGTPLPNNTGRTRGSRRP